nr:MAG TPA: hypothetical protein [Caudoviricetes sp.]
MAERCKEPLCTHCIHREVCVYKEDYLELVRVLQTLRISKTVGNTIRSTLVSNLAFFGENTPPCRFHRENLPEPRGAHNA